MKRFILVSLASALVFWIGARTSLADCGTCDKTVVEVAVQTDGFKTLVAAVKAADLVETLSGKGPFTVFAPTDEAFAKLPTHDGHAKLDASHEWKHSAGVLFFHCG